METEATVDTEEFTSRKKKRSNPFYPPVVLVGSAFVVTSVAYVIVLVRSVKHRSDWAQAASHPLFELLEEHGNWVLGIELGLLGFFSLGLIVWDAYKSLK